MNAVGVMFTPIRNGRPIKLTDGREVTRFTGPAAKRQAHRTSPPTTSRPALPAELRPSKDLAHAFPA